VASKNPVKLAAATHGFQRMFPADALTVDGVNVPSGVRDQPMSDDETLLGATHRARAALDAIPLADYAVGIEGGCEDSAHGLSVFAWIVVIGRDGRLGRSRTAMFYLPEEIARHVRDGLELGDADDIVFGQSNSKQQNGSVGLLTGDVLTRETYYTEALILALIPFKNPTLTFAG
ncbi:MAG: inosine/xanthosine triphosphatase, partial [Phototrophicaceae bacterium]